MPNVSAALYNGNIAGMSVNIPKAGEPLYYNYKYDQLNRLVNMNAYNGLNTQTNQWAPVALNGFAEQVAYDPNGNILTYKRNGSVAKPDMDKMTYQYPKDANGNALNNRLRYVHDEVAAANYTEDIDSQTPLTLAQVQAEKLPEQVGDNYGYDAIGNLVKDAKEGITAIQWSVYGKIRKINKNGSVIAYGYDASGNRIGKVAASKATFYVRDASGNVMSVYEVDPNLNQGKLTQTETHLYGSSRLGVVNARTVLTQAKPVAAGFGAGMLGTFTRGEKLFELSNHLGNVLATVNDKKLQVDDNADGVVNYYTADVMTAQDYAPFGMQMVGRKFSAPNAGYRYGFNGKENDNEVKGEGNQQDYGMRIYDTRLGRFLSVDPLTESYPWYTPYQYAGNKPIWCIDLDGLEDIPTNGGNYYSIESLKQWAFRDIVVQEAVKRGQRVVLNQTYSVISNGQRDQVKREIVLNEGTIGSQVQEVYQDGNFYESGALGPSGITMTFGSGGIYEPTPSVSEPSITPQLPQNPPISDASSLVATKTAIPVPVKATSLNPPKPKPRITKPNLLLTNKVKPTVKIFNDVPMIIVSDRADNGDIISSIGDFSNKLKKSLNSIKKGSSVSEIKINISIVMSNGDGATNNMLSYILKARAKIARQIQQSVQKTTGIDKSKINVNVTATNGNNSDSKTTISIK